MDNTKNMLHSQTAQWHTITINIVLYFKSHIKHIIIESNCAIYRLTCIRKYGNDCIFDEYIK